MNFFVKIGLCLISITLFSCNNEVQNFRKDNIQNKQSIFLIFRGTETKEGIIAKEFNKNNPNPSHVGIMIFDRGNWNIYHVIDNGNRNAFTKSSFEEFCKLENGKITYLALYQFKEFSQFNRSKLLKNIASFNKKKIEFDKSFHINNGKSKLYCSEFIVNLLEDCFLITIPIHKIPLKSISSTYLKRDTLYYYPVDSLMELSILEFVDEIKLN